MASVFPQFPDPPETLVARAIESRLRESTWQLMEYLAGGMRIYEVDALVSEELLPPHLGIVTDGVEELFVETSFGADYFTTTLLVLVTEIRDRGANDDSHLRTRVLGHVRRALTARDLCLYADDGRVIATLVAFERLPSPAQLPGTGLLATSLRLRHRTHLHAITRELS